MRIPSWLVVTAAVVMALPCGWGLGVVAAEAAVGRDVGVLPALTIPIAVIGLAAFALSPVATPPIRLAILTAGTVLLLLIG